MSRLSTRMDSMEQSFQLAMQLCEESGEEELLALTDSLNSVIVDFEDYVKTIYDTASARDFVKLPALIDGLIALHLFQLDTDGRNLFIQLADLSDF